MGTHREYYLRWSTRFLSRSLLWSKYICFGILYTRGSRRTGQIVIMDNIVSPGPVQIGWITPELEALITAETPLGRAGQPEDLADVIVFLASEQARWVTGQMISVSGGRRKFSQPRLSQKWSSVTSEEGSSPDKKMIPSRVAFPLDTTRNGIGKNSSSTDVLGGLGCHGCDKLTRCPLSQ